MPEEDWVPTNEAEFRPWLARKVVRLEQGMFGSPLEPSKGLISRVERLEEEVNTRLENRKFIRRAVWGSAISTLTAAAMAIMTAVFAYAARNARAELREAQSPPHAVGQPDRNPSVGG